MASGARPQFAGLGFGGGRVTKRAHARQGMSPGPEFETAGCGETPVTQPVSARGLRRKQCCQALLGALVHIPQCPGRARGASQRPQLGSTAARDSMARSATAQHCPGVSLQ